MSVPLPGALGRDTDEFPWFRWGVPVTLDVAKMASAVQEKFWFSTSLFMSIGRGDSPLEVWKMWCSSARGQLVLRIFVPGGVLSRPPEHKYIRPLIPVKVVGVCQEVVGVAIASTQFSGKAWQFLFFSCLLISNVSLSE